MNLDANPAKQQLRELIAARDDEAGHHILWVTKRGDVELSAVPGDKTPAGFEQAHPEMQMRYETFLAGNQYVGPEAADDEEWVSELFNSLLKEWRTAKGKPDAVFIDLF
jgi:hypothetical protein